MNEAYCGPAPTPVSLLASWNLDPVAIALCATLVVTAAYRCSRPRSLAVAVALLLLAFVSPLCALTTALFSARVLHHVLLVAVVAPLLALSFPARRESGPAAPLGVLVAVHALTLWLWHYPPLYGQAVYSPLLYWTMQLSLLGTGFFMWRRIFAAENMGPALLGLFATVVQMGMLGALLTFMPEPVYRPHLLTTAPFMLSPLEDQQLAGLIMWVPAALPYLAVALRLVFMRLGAGMTMEPRGG